MDASGAVPQRQTSLSPQVQDPSCCLLYGFKVAFGGGRSTGFGMIYDNLVAAKKFEPKYRLTRVRSPAATPAVGSISRKTGRTLRVVEPVTGCTRAWTCGADLFRFACAVWHGQGEGRRAQAAQGEEESGEEGARRAPCTRATHRTWCIVPWRAPTHSPPAALYPLSQVRGLKKAKALGAA